MKTNFIFRSIILLFSQVVFSQVGIGTTTPDPSSELDVSSPLNDKGVLIPRMLEAERNLIATPATSLLIYQTDNTPGFYYFNGTIWVRLAAGASTDWSLSGNPGTSAATNFIGTTDDVDFVLRRNDIRAGYLGNPFGATLTTVDRRNTSFGANSLLTPATGYRNTVIGSNAMSTNTTGNRNVAIGDAALASNVSGIENTAVGVGALFSNVSNNSNTAIGRNALTTSTASFNTALGDRALTANTVGTLNTATGVNSLFKNLDGSNNTANGVQAIRANTSGLNNTAMGFQALSGNPTIAANTSTFSNNTAVGYHSLLNNLTGNDNTAIGARAGIGVTGANNISIGANSEVAVVANSNQLSIGNVIYGKDMTSTSAGKIGIGVSNPNAKLHVNSSGSDLIGIFNEFIPNTNTSFLRTGINNIVTGNTTDTIFGTFNNVTNSGTGSITGWANQISGVVGNTFLTGNNTVITGVSNTIGNSNFLTNNNTADPTMGMYSYSSNLAGTSNGIIRGTDTSIGVSGTGNHYGNYNLLAGNGNTVGGSSHYGNFNLLTGTGTTTKYGNYNRLNTTAGGTHYGVYSEVLKPGATNFAGYFLGNVGIGTTSINTYTMPASRGTLNQIMQTDGTGVVTWQNPSAALNSSAWLTTGNSGMTANFIGTTDANPLIFRISNLERMRIVPGGEVVVGNTVAVVGDRFSVYATGTQFGVRAYSTLAGSGVVGQNTGSGSGVVGINNLTGVGVFGNNVGTGVGVQGQSSNVAGTALVGFNTAAATAAGTGIGVIGQTAQRDGAGVLGFNNGPAGTSFGWQFGFSRASVYGNGITTGSYAFGVIGDGGTSTRSGGVFGDNFGVARGALGYFDSAGTDYAVYGFGQAFTIGGGAGRSANQENNMVGLGIYGGVMGGWVRGLNYGLHAKGKEYGMYVDGNTITNKPVIQLIENGMEKRSVAFTTTSMTADVYVRGNNTLANGSVYITFKKNFSEIVSDKIPMNITVTPTGASKGVYVTDITNNGFRVVENDNGNSNVAINWVAYGTRLGYENPDEILSDEILSSKFDENMDAVMYNDNNTDGKEKGIWFDGNKVQTGKTPTSFIQKKLATPKTKQTQNVKVFEKLDSYLQETNTEKK